MERLKRVCKKIFFLKPLPTVLIAVPSFVFVCIVLCMEDHSALSYVAYLLSAYAMIVTITGMPRIIDAIRTGIREMVILSRLVDTFFSRISLTMPPAPKSHNTACVLPQEEPLHWQSRSSGYSSS